MRKLSLDDTWDYTKRMWKWVAFQKEVLKDERSVDLLKKVWLQENAPEFVGMVSSCFFCYKHTGVCEETCPGWLVDKSFDCFSDAYDYSNKPAAFYREILRLDAIRTAAPVVPEHKWVHGDVFENFIGFWIYLVRAGKPCVTTINSPHLGGVPEVQLNNRCGDVQFLFNIEDALSDRGIV